jgi:hypothetical protein
LQLHRTPNKKSPRDRRQSGEKPPVGPSSGSVAGLTTLDSILLVMGDAAMMGDQQSAGA